MAEKIDIKQGFVNILKKLLHSESFVNAFFRLLLGEKDAPNDLKVMFLRTGRDYGINEMVTAHRIFKGQVNEESAAEKDSNIVRQVYEIWEKSYTFQTDVIVTALKKPGTVGALYRLIKSGGNDTVAWKTVADTVIESAQEVSDKNKEMELALNETVMMEKMRRAFRHGSRSCSVLSEEFEDRYGGRMPVNVYTGRFQPFHLGHLSNLQEAAKRGLRTVICPVMAGKTAKSIAAHPFNGELEDEMFNRLKTAYGDLIADIIPISKPSLDCWVEAIRERGMEPITWTTGMDRKPSYDAMIQRYGQDFNLVDNFEVIGLDKDMDAEGGSADDTGKISGTAIRKCIAEGNEEGFRAQMPRCLWDMYDAFRQALMPAQQTITESKAYEDFRKYLNQGLDELLK